MSPIKKNDIAKLAFEIRNIQGEGKNDPEVFYKIYSVILCNALAYSKDSLSYQAKDGLLVNANNLLCKFYSVQEDPEDDEVERLVPISVKDSYENIIRHHFQTHYPELELELKNYNNTSQNPHFILGVMLAVTGALLLLFTIAIFAGVTPTTGILVSGVVGVSGAFNLWSGLKLTLSDSGESESTSSSFALT